MKQKGYKVLSAVLSFLLLFSAVFGTGSEAAVFAAEAGGVQNEGFYLVAEEPDTPGFTVEDVTGPETVNTGTGSSGQSDAVAAESYAVGANMCGDSLLWSYENGVLTITGTGDMYDYDNSSKKAPWADNMANITELKLPNGITSIGSYAFCNTTALETQLTIPEGVKRIGNNAFESSAITGDLMIPGTVASLGESVFSKCSGLTGELIMSSGAGALTEIPKYAFYHVPFAKITLPTTLQAIRSYAFDGFSKGDQRSVVVIPALVNRIDDYAFYDSKAVFYFKGNVPAYSLSDPYNNLWQVNHPLGYNNGDGKIYYIEGNSGWIANVNTTLSNYTMNAVPADDEHFKTVNDSVVLPDKSDSGSCGTNLTWAVSGTMADLTLTITGTGKMSNYSESSAAPWSKYMGAIRHLSLPNGLTSIGDYAFCKSYALTGALNIPGTVTAIGAHAFDRSGFCNTKLTIPSSVKTIGDYAFDHCRGICGLELNSGLESIGSYAFQYCAGLNGGFTIPGTLRELKDHAFYECRNTSGSLIIRSGLEEIERYAFYRNGFNDVTLPSTLLIVKQDAFYCCDNVTKYVVPALVYNIGADAFDQNSGGKLTEIWFKGNAPFERDGSGAEDWKGYLGDVNTVKIHYVKGRSGWTNPWSGYATVQETSDEAEGFSDANDDEKLPEVSDGGDCGSNLEWAVSGTPDDLTLKLTGKGRMDSIAKEEAAPWHAYRHQIRHLILPDELTTISDYAFRNLTAVNGDLVIPSGVESIGKYAFENTGYGNSKLIIPSNVKTISDYAFSKSGRMGRLTIENGVGYIGTRAFAYGNGFRGDLEIPESVTYIGEYAFVQCYSLDGTLTVNANLKKMERGAFESCGFSEIILPGSLESIEDYTFSKCDAATKITIPPLVDFVASSAFSHKDYSKANPRSVYFEGDAPTNSREKTYADSALSQAFGNKTKVTLYYVEGKEGWTSPTWHDYPTLTWEGPKEIAVTSVNVTPESVTLKPKGTQQLTVRVLPANATNRKVTYTTDKEAVATVSNTGLITAVADGKATITVTTEDGKKTATCAVTVSSGETPPEPDIPDGYVDATDLIVVNEEGWIIKYNGGDAAKGTAYPKIYLPDKKDGVTIIGIKDEGTPGVFEEHEELVEVRFPANLKTVGFRSFLECTSLVSADLSNTKVEKIGQYAFQNCTALTGVKFPADTLKTIGPNSFMRAALGTEAVPGEITIPASVETVGFDAFDRCSHLGKVIFESGTTKLTFTANGSGSTIFEECPALTEIVLSERIEKIPAFFARYSPKLIRVTIPDSVTEIGSHAFLVSDETEITVTCTKDNSVVANYDWKDDKRILKYSGEDPKPVKAEYTVEFYYEDEEGKTQELTSARQKVVSGESVDFPDAPPAPNGYKFIGWCVGEPDGAVWDETAPVLSDLDLHARYMRNDGEGYENHSGLDPELVFEEEEDLYSVKGQKFNLPEDFVWSSETPAIVKITKNYKAEAKKAGMAVVTGTKDGEPDKVYHIYVTEPKLVAAEPEAQKNKTTLQLVEGNTGKLMLTGMDVEKEALDGTKVIENAEDEYDITWITSNPEIAKVEQGRVFGVAKGNAKITAYLCGKAYTVSVKVTDIYGVTEYTGAFKLTPLQTVTVKYKGEKNFKLNKDTVWTSSIGWKDDQNQKDKKGNITAYRDGVVQVTPAGKLTAIGVGETILTAVSKGIEKSFMVIVENIEPKTVYINQGKSKNIKFYNMKFTGATPAVGQIAPEYQSVVKFAGTGSKQATITALSPGKAKILYRYDPYMTGGFLYTVNVYAENPSLEPVKTEAGELTLTKGTTYNLELKQGKSFVLEVKDAYQNVVFTSNKKDLVFVDEMGVVQARGAAKKNAATLTAKINGTKFTVKVTIL